MNELKKKTNINRHGGSKCAQYVRDNLHLNLEKSFQEILGKF